MAVTTAVLSGTIDDLIGSLDPKYLARITLVVEANTPGSLLLDTAGNRHLAGAKRIPIDKNTGAYSATLVTTNSADIVPTTGRLYRATLIYPSGTPGAGNVTQVSGWFQLTANASLADIWPGLATTEVATTVYENMTDSLMTGIDSNSASGFRVQQDARHASTFGIKGNDPARALPALGYVKQQLSDANSNGMVIWTQKVAGDSTDVNVDGSVIVKHGKNYALTDGYADTLQVYTLAGSAGTIIGNNDYSGYESALPYAPGTTENGSGFIRFELGPRWPRSEVGRFNNTGDFMLGGLNIFGTVGELYSQSGTTITQTTGANNFSAADVGRYFQWHGPGCDGTMDRITGYISPTQVTVETSRTRTSLGGRKVVPGLTIRPNQTIETFNGLTVTGSFTVNATLPVSFTSQLKVGSQAADGAADVHITTQANADKGLVIRPQSSGQSANLLETQYADTTYSFAIDKEGRPRWSSLNAQTTVGAAGGAAALPATPKRYLRVLDSDGTVLVVPAYPSA